MKIAFSTLGCKVNQTESASIEGLLKSHGYEIVPFTEKADLYIINTCTVTNKSDYQSRQLIRKAHNKGGRVLVTGCYAELQKDEIKKIKGVDIILKNEEKSKILDYITAKFEHVKLPDSSLVEAKEQPLHIYYSSTRSRAFLKVQDGCDACCAYCTVPLARGKSRSLDMNKAIEAFDLLVDKGYQEIVLTGIHIGRYGQDLKPQRSLFDLIQALINKKSDVRLRLSSIEPEEFNLSCLSFIEEGLICPHLHFPLQSGSDSVLNGMKRRGNSTYFKELILNIYNDIPDIALGTDLIAGLPSETEDDFMKTCNLVNELPLSYFHVFPYSARPGTTAASMKNQNPPSVIKERAKILRTISQTKHSHYMAGFTQKSLDIIVEDKIGNSEYAKGISENYLKVLLPASDVSPGQRIAADVMDIKQGHLLCIPQRIRYT